MNSPATTPNPVIHQVAELPKIEPIVDEYRLHRLTCPACGETTCGALPPGVPTGCFGPYLQAVLAMFAGAYRLSKRQIQQLAADLFTLSISTGMISKLERQSAAVLEAPYNELAISVHHAEAANIDETSWRQDRRKAWLWATVTPLVHGLHHRQEPLAARSPRRSWGAKTDQVVGSDRFSAYEWIMALWRQVCWAHLRRDFQAMIDRVGERQGHSYFPKQLAQSGQNSGPPHELRPFLGRRGPTTLSRKRVLRSALDCRPHSNEAYDPDDEPMSRKSAGDSRRTIRTTVSRVSRTRSPGVGTRNSVAPTGRLPIPTRRTGTAQVTRAPPTYYRAAALASRRRLVSVCSV